MSISHDLLEQAEHLVSHDQTRPKQASLRRAVSTAYYAVFRLLVEEASSNLVADRDLRLLVARVLQHGEMKETAKLFAKGKLTGNRAMVFVPTVPKELQEVAAAFVDLQEARHKADYDFATRFTRTEALRYVHLARKAFDGWSQVRGNKAARIFLLGLVFGQRWNR